MNLLPTDTALQSGLEIFNSKYFIRFKYFTGVRFPHIVWPNLNLNQHLVHCGRVWNSMLMQLGAEACKYRRVSRVYSLATFLDWMPPRHDNTVHFKATQCVFSTLKWYLQNPFYFSMMCNRENCTPAVDTAGYKASFKTIGRLPSNLLQEHACPVSFSATLCSSLSPLPCHLLWSLWRH